MATYQNDPARALDSREVAIDSSPSLLANIMLSALTTSSVNLAALVEDDYDPSHDESGKTSIWGAGNVRLGKRNQTSGEVVDFRTDGASLGFDQRIDQELALGMGLGYARDKSTIGTDGSRNTSNARSIAAYGSYLPSPTTFIDILVGYGALNFNTDRYVLSANDFARAQRKGSQVFSSLAAGYEYRADGFLVSPYGRIDLVTSRLAAATETGGGSNALIYSSQNWNTSQGAIGLRTESSYLTDSGWLLPHARIEYQHSIEEGQQASMVYADQPNGSLYSVYPASVNANSLTLGLGSDFELSSGLKLGFEFQSLRSVGAGGSAGTEKNHAFSFKLSKELGGR